MQAASRALKAVATSRLRTICQFDRSVICQGVRVRSFSELVEEKKEESSAPARDFQELREELNAKPSECVELVKDWIKQGNQLTQENSIELYESLSRRKQYREALQIIDYTRAEKVFKPTSESCIFQLKLTCREYGAPPTERIFKKLPRNMKTDNVIATFLTSLTKNKSAYKALKSIDELKLDPKTSTLYSAVIGVYYALNLHEKMLSMYTAMKGKGLEPTLYTALVMLKLKSRIGGLEGLEQEAKEVANKVDMTDKNNLSDLNQAMEVYARLGEADKVEKAWETVQGLEDPLYDCYLSALNSFSLLGNVDKAEQVFQRMLELKTKRPGSSPYFRILTIYAKQGLLDKAELVLDQNITGSEKNFFPYNCLVAGYLAKGDTETAMQKLKKGYEYRNACPSYEVVRGLLPVFEKEKDVEGAEKLVRCYIRKFLGDVHVYNGLLKVYIAANKKPADLLKKLIFEPNEETEELREKATD